MLGAFYPRKLIFSKSDVSTVFIAPAWRERNAMTPSTPNLLITNGTILDPCSGEERNADILIRDGKIAVQTYASYTG